MYRLCLLGCVVFLAACGEKAPDEGAIRVSVKYGSFKPACVRVEAKDASGHQGATDIPSSQFKNAEKNEVLVAVRRKADWDMALSVTASSYASATATGCDGPFVEQHSSNGPLTIVARKFTNFDVTLKATDADGDGHLAGAMWSEPADCDDSNPARHPGAVETCGSTVDLNCNERTGCQEENCWGNPCDDGNACTTGDRCEGSGLEAKCVPTQTTTCTQPTGVCDARLACNPASGLCEAAESTVGKSCNDGNACTDGDQCGADGKCGGTARTCTTSEQCLSRSGTCNPANGQCVFTPLPATTACQDPVACTTPDRCDGNGNCVGTPTTCTPPPCYRVKQQCTANTECEYEVDLNGTCTTSGGVPGVCSATAECSPFPYRPSNFDPNSIAAADIGELRTSGSVTFDTTSRTWSPPGQVPTRDSIKYVLLDQGAGNPQAVLIPVSALALNGTLTITGPNPVIFAVYGSATVAQSILATGTIDTPNAACGTSQGGAGTASGSTGGGGGGGGNGTPGADGGNAYNAQNRGAAGINRATGPEPLLGGCPGGNGGAGASGGRGGAGGGAIQLSVAQTLTLDKNLSTSGNGGAGGTTGGGGGGGSGGQVVLEAFQLNLTAAARITANGGGGAEGGTTTSNAGSAGANGNQSSGAPATGGTGNNATGGAGGAGGAGMTPPVRGTDGTRDGFGTEGSGGGGGGSVGYIHLRSVQPCALAVGHVLSPPATTPCTQP